VAWSAIHPGPARNRSHQRPSPGPAGVVACTGEGEQIIQRFLAHSVYERLETIHEAPAEIARWGAARERSEPVTTDGNPALHAAPERVHPQPARQRESRPARHSEIVVDKRPCQTRRKRQAKEYTDRQKRSDEPTEDPSSHRPVSRATSLESSSAMIRQPPPKKWPVSAKSVSGTMPLFQ
jgi:hypothetical protein